MYYKFLKNLATVVVLSVLPLASWAQTGIGNSPFTLNGIGEIATNANIRSIGMGGVGISNGTYWNVNIENPALLSKNLFTSFEMAMLAESRKVETLDESQSYGGGVPAYITLVFPIKASIWSSGIGLQPYSNVNYNLVTEQEIPNTPHSANYQFTGEGGLNQAYWANGFAVNKNFRVGFKVNYYFGSIIKTSKASLDQNSSISNNFVNESAERIKFSDLNLDLGVVYEIPLGGEENKGKSFNIGAVYKTNGDIKSQRFFNLEQTLGVGTVTAGDTIVNDVTGAVKIPSSLGIGISYTDDKKFAVGFDYSIQDWTEYRSFDGTTDPLESASNIELGAEFTPDIFGKYYQQVTYRIGFNYENTPFNVNGEQLKDFGMNIGMSLPVGGPSRLNLGAKFGQRGTLEEGSIRERYAKVYIGITFNDNRWFYRPTVN